MDQNSERSAFSEGANTVLGSPLRLLSGTVIYVAALFCISTMGYVRAGWPLGDAAYMVLLTIFSVGYGEVRPIDTTFLRVWTTITIVLGCTGMIVLTGALVQVFTLFQFRRLLGLDRMHTEIEKLSNHAIICGYGRIGVQLAKALTEARHPFLILERSVAKAEEAKAHGYLTLVGEATHEETLKAAGIDRARVLATVLPDDAANVFITLSAKNLNPAVKIIARGEAPTTENKLFHAGADKVVLPTHIGAERITELILYPATDAMTDGADIGDVKRNLHDFGLDLEVVRAADKGALTGETVGEAERRGNGAFFIVRIDRVGGQAIEHPGEDVKIEAGDQVMLVVRGSRLSAGAIFSAPARPVRQGRGFIG
ncbi:NAD-binding protein [Novosphingobium sp. KCTC 2891]|uniref:potassium channel family protein n=1 Tax=Novosphingobium sp. KCTC 2891 TaxID=2989730 RepID=UPI0022224D9A|nr:potassium channel protein [Novosphingobium sp. KCTC 2891]MCW1381475.1 NAD-binding protein [Novosphingobium sp. KCTC 2891]